MKFNPFIAFFVFALLPQQKFVQVVADLDSDKQALLEFANGVPHVKKLNWNLATPVCTSWVGITCNTNGTDVIAVRLPGVGLYGTIPRNTIAVIFISRLKRKHSGSNGMLKSKISQNDKPNDFGSGVQEAEKNKLFFFEGCSYNFDLEDLLKASAEVLGKGSYGTTYKAALEEGTQVVVKRLKEVAVGKKEFEQQMEVVNRVGRHPNVVPLRAYYYSKDEKLLVYNYMPAGSLFALLHGNRTSERTPLDWDTRMKIALGTARGIANIHTEGGGKFTHGNIKSSNVLLSDELEACVSDAGLTPLMNAPLTTSRIVGYRAPEVIETRKITQKSDVYSFGVLLLEMLTAKAPLQPSGQDDVVDLPRWVRSVVREEWTAEVFDVELLRFQTFQEEMVQMLQIALTCVAKTPDMRPTMDEAIRMIEDVRQSESKNRTSSEADSNIQTP
ncbi:hypothetical protein ERO13_D06G187400v2 [Gossypium hirsutum]|nr:hypothetical protein ERO13_D06G187400v2 [Gossypium hirsutum]